MAPFSNGFPASASGSRSSSDGSKAEPPPTTLSSKSQSGLLPTIQDIATPERDAVPLSSLSYTAAGMMTRSNSGNMLARNSGGLGTNSYMRGVMHQQAATRVRGRADFGREREVSG